MSVKPAAFLTVAAACLVGSTASAQTLVEQSRARAPAGTTFVAGFANHVNSVREVEIYSLNRATGVELVRVARRSRRTADGPVVEGWTDSSACPALTQVVIDMTNLPGLQLSIPGVTAQSSLRPTPGPATIGGPGEVWGLARQADNAFATVHMTATVGFLKDWVGLAEEALAPCWTDAEPPVLERR
ncbi:MAG: hypothetical protein KJ676_01850 [Alphaproteobacteria bacterium]|nr:hypothetical protein [Alphaproteobacteria bacterium]MBU1524970.1 hypothetical protein [Alphaproteobacteria bacterium]MBU2117959.1 hypothetical protein [Alphaproteobacteria bacterium]MBU2350103.1 hypothetical protein [Alphaproteobacteria bacterium]MBU2381990.1 hypothetical protein [Alphaproteobacteria bacterium]